MTTYELLMLSASSSTSRHQLFQADWIWMATTVCSDPQEASERELVSSMLLFVKIDSDHIQVDGSASFVQPLHVIACRGGKNCIACWADIRQVAEPASYWPPPCLQSAKIESWRDMRCDVGERESQQKMCKQLQRSPAKGT